LKAAILSLVIALGGWYATSDGYRLAYANAPAVPLDWPSPDPRAPEGPPFVGFDSRALRARCAARALHWFTIARFKDLGILRRPAQAAVRWVCNALAALETDEEVIRLIKLVPVHYAAMPTLVQANCSALNQTSFSDWIGEFCHPCQAGNFLVFYVQVEGVPTFTITTMDSGGATTTNNWTAGPSITSGNNLYTYYCPGVSAKTQIVKIAFGSAFANYSATVLEYCNVFTSSPLDGSNAVALSATTAVGLSVTTATDGNLVVQFACQDSLAAGTWQGASFTANANFELVQAELFSGLATQHAIQTTHGTNTYTITASTSADWVTAILSFKTIAAGSPIPGGVVRVKKRQVTSCNLATGVLTHVVQFPITTGNLVVMVINSSDTNASDHKVTSVVDNGNNNFFTAATANRFTASSSTANQSIWYSPLASAVTPLATITFVNTVTECICYNYEVLGTSAVKVLGATYTVTGNQASAGTLTGGSIVPTKAGSFVVGYMSVDFGTVHQVTAPPAAIMANWYSTGMNAGEAGGGSFNQGEEDNGSAVCISPDLSTQLYSWGNPDPINGVSTWAVLLAEFVPAAVNSPAIFGAA
jgi:hypothetical protein